MAIPAGLVLLAASAALKYANETQAQKRQAKLLDAMRAYQNIKSAEGLAATEQLLAKQTPEARGTELGQVTAAREQSLRDTVGAAQAFEAGPAAGRQSGDFQAAQEREASSVAERTRRAIEHLAAMGAPGEQKFQHQLRFSKAAGAVDAANSASENVGRAYRTSIAATRPDPFADMLSSVGMAVGSGIMGGTSAGEPTAGAAGTGATADGGAGKATTASSSRAAIAARSARMNRGFSLWGQQ
jgi:hypothetical protein